MSTATIKTQHQSNSLNIKTASLGNAVLDLCHFDMPFYFQDIGLKHTSFCESAICYIDGNNSTLLYRGYPIEELATHFSFSAITYLLQHDHLPSEKELSSFHNDCQKYMSIPQHCYAALKTLPRDCHPMGILMVLIGILSSQESEILDDDIQMSRKIIAQMPILVAMAQRHSSGLDPIQPNPELNYVENFLYMLTGKPADDLTIEVFDTILTLHAEHEQNASTCTLRVSGSTGTNAYAALASAVSALWGPAHGGANEACLTMLETIANSDRISEFVNKAKSKSDPFRLMGFGHRVYRNKDPRALIMKDLCQRVLDQKQHDPLFKLARELEQFALSDPYFISHQLYPNVDYYSGIAQRALGIEKKSFTTVFALARVSGWMSHWLEMKSKNTPIIRPRQHYIGHTTRHV